MYRMLHANHKDLLRIESLSMMPEDAGHSDRMLRTDRTA